MNKISASPNRLRRSLLKLTVASAALVIAMGSGLIAAEVSLTAIV